MKRRTFLKALSLVTLLPAIQLLGVREARTRITNGWILRQDDD